MKDNQLIFSHEIEGFHLLDINQRYLFLVLKIFYQHHKKQSYNIEVSWLN